MDLTENRFGMILPLIIRALKNSGGGSGGTVTPEQIQAAVDQYLEENPVSAGELSVSNHIISLVGGNSNENP